MHNHVTQWTMYLNHDWPLQVTQELQDQLQGLHKHTNQMSWMSNSSYVLREFLSTETQCTKGDPRSIFKAIMMQRWLYKLAEPKWLKKAKPAMQTFSQKFSDCKKFFDSTDRKLFIFNKTHYQPATKSFFCRQNFSIYVWRKANTESKIKNSCFQFQRSICSVRWVKCTRPGAVWHFSDISFHAFLLFLVLGRWKAQCFLLLQMRTYEIPWNS